MRLAHTPATTAAALVFSLGVEGIMGISAMLHKVHWRSENMLERARLADYSMIFVGIALIYQSLGASLLGHTRVFHYAILPLVWGGATIGIGTKAVSLNQPRWVEAIAFLSQGWACMLGAKPMREAITSKEWRLLLSGGLSITAGVAAYIAQWPDFRWHRKKFRAHDAFHLSTMGMFACFYCAMDSLMRRLPEGAYKGAA
jgi:hemolysin III